MSNRTGSARRVVVTGLGAVSPVGCGVPEFWRGITSGTIGTREVTRFSTDQLAGRRAGEVTGHVPHGGLEPERARHLPRAVRYATSAAAMAVVEAGIAEPGTYDPDRVGVCFGTVMGTRPHLEECLRTGQPLAGRAAWARPDLIASVPAEVFGFRGPRTVLATGCAAGNDAIGRAAALIATGRADAMVTGGADELSHAVFLLFTSLDVLEHDVIRPFDVNRRGTMPSEGAGAMVLESLSAAHARGATIHAEVLACAAAEDAHHITAPHPEGLGLRRCVRSVLARAELAADEVSYVSAHGTGTPASDEIEARAVAAALGRRESPVPMSSLKGMLGHAQGAASALEAVACVTAIRTGVVPGNPTLRHPDADCSGVDLIAGTRRHVDPDVVLSTAFGFGGNVSVLALGSPRVGGWG